MTGSRELDAKLNEFKPKDRNADKSTVLGTDSDVGTEVGEIQWKTFGETLENLVKYRDSINPGYVRDTAGKWRDHGEALKTLAAQFSNEVKSKIIDSWDSDAAGTASQAVQKYADQLSQLPTVISAVAHSLDFSAEFLEATKNSIPDQYGQLTNGKNIVTTVDNYQGGNDAHYRDSTDGGI